MFEYAYDAAGRVQSVSRTGTLVVRYTYDANGNRLQEEGERGFFTATYDDQDRLLTHAGAVYTYAPDGSLATKTVGGQRTTYDYDSLGNMTRVVLPDGRVITYVIDGRGRRVAKAIDGVRVKTWLDADQLRPIAELDATGSVVARFVYGSRPNIPDYMVKDGVTYRILPDHLGSPRVILNAETGEVVHRMDFGAFGELIQDSSPGFQPFGFAGGLYDSDTGLVRFGARDYDPHTGRWTAKDALGFGGRSANLYGYVLGQPLDQIDPSGHLVGAAIGGMLIGGINGAIGASAAPNATAGDVVQGALVGAAVGGLFGAFDISEGFLTGAASGLFGNLAGQLVNNSSLTCLNLTSAALSALGGAGAGGVAGAIKSTAASIGVNVTQAGDVFINAATAPISWTPDMAGAMSGPGRSGR